MSNIRWYLNPKGKEAVGDDALPSLLLDMFSDGGSGKFPKFQINVDHPLSPSLQIFNEVLATLEEHSLQVSYRGTVRRVKLLQGVYDANGTKASVYALSDGDYRVEIVAEHLSQIQSMYLDMLTGKTIPKDVWRGVVDK